MNRALPVRILFALVCLFPFVYLLIWIAIGEANSENIRHPDLRRFYEEMHLEIDWYFLWVSRAVVVFLLVMAFRRYLFKVRSLLGSVIAGFLLAAATAGYFLAITSYQVAETRLAFHPYLSGGLPSIYPETVSLWLPLYLFAVGIIVGVAPLFELTTDSPAQSDANLP
ncbi:MAG TPA: hypothetical protein VHJ82_00570 [Actinomycetota bacterium]|nr:hypothetical protein [Actinomycetota bacterium]